MLSAAGGGHGGRGRSGLGAAAAAGAAAESDFVGGLRRRPEVVALEAGDEGRFVDDVRGACVIYIKNGVVCSNLHTFRTLFSPRSIFVHNRCSFLHRDGRSISDL